jgi:hypothetical protein
MSDTVILALIVGLPLIITAISNLIVAVSARKQSTKNTEIALATASKLDEVHGQINGKMEQLIKATGAEEHAAGVAEGREKSIAERAGRVAEEERVEDRAVEKKRGDGS